MQETYKPAVLHGYMQPVVANLHVPLILGFQSEINPAIRMCFTTVANPVGRSWDFIAESGDTRLLVVTFV